MTGVKGWYMPALKVLMYTFGTAAAGLCLAFGIGLLLAGPADAATSGSSGSGLPGSVSGTVSAAGGTVSAVGGAVGSATGTATQTASSAVGDLT
ncbi:MAG: hypothetical protein WAK82_26850, partial [Streptosporangiaceae bacterium]